MPLLAFRNIACPHVQLHNPWMDLAHLFLEFFQTVALGSVTVFALLGVVRLRSAPPLARTDSRQIVAVVIPAG